MDEIMMDDPSGMVLYEEEVTTANEIMPCVSSWDEQKPVGYELTDTKCYKTPSGVQKTATIQREQLGSSSQSSKDLIGEQQIVETDGEFSIDTMDCLLEPSTSMTSEPSASSYQPDPLKKLAIKIGERILRFKVINASDAPEAPIGSPGGSESSGWIDDPKPLTAPKALAGLFHCISCKTYFGNKEVYQRHVMEVHGDARPFRCFNCGMRFANKTSMTHHLKDHSLLRPVYQCAYCPRIFSNADNRNKHHKRHFTRITCQTCMRFFMTEEALQNHQATAHQSDFGDPPSTDLLPNGKTARFSCSYCNLRFHFKKDMIVHERVHTGEKPYSCGYCGKSFAQSQALTAHIRTHTKEMPYLCAKCQKRFRDNSCLRKHELSAHTAEPIMRPIVTVTNNTEIQRENRRKQQLIMADRNPQFPQKL